MPIIDRHPSTPATMSLSTSFLLETPRTSGFALQSPRLGQFQSIDHTLSTPSFGTRFVEADDDGDFLLETDEELTLDDWERFVVQWRQEEVAIVANGGTKDQVREANRWVQRAEKQVKSMMEEAEFARKNEQWQDEERARRERVASEQLSWVARLTMEGELEIVVQPEVHEVAQTTKIIVDTARTA
jgi:hypothetical protein